LPALVSSGEQSFPVVLEGIDPGREVRVTNVRDTLVEGEFLPLEPEAQCSRAAYMSRSMAKLLGVSLGNKVVVLAQAADGTLGNELLRVKGLFDTGSPEYDKGVVFTSLACVRLIGALSGLHEISIHLNGGADEGSIRREIAAKLPPGLSVMSWREVQPRLAAMTNFNDATLILVSVMLFIVISLGILNTFLVTVFERTTEFGVMMALGTAPWRVVVLVLVEGLLLGLAAALIGIVVGACAIAYHDHVGFDLTPLVGQSLSVGAFKLNLLIYPVVNGAAALKATGLTLVVVVAAAIYPALRASRLRPIDAIRSV
jgi:ABC-type lipoprotein release transport system permease subunit